jgi:hypothetical protein
VTDLKIIAAPPPPATITVPIRGVIEIPAAPGLHQLEGRVRVIEEKLSSLVDCLIRLRN